MSSGSRQQHETPRRKPDAYGLTSRFREQRGLPSDGISGGPPNFACPGCDKIMSHREKDEQGMCNECLGLVEPRRVP